MRTLLVIFACTALSAGAAFAVVRTAGPDTALLDADIKAAKAQFDEVNAEAAKYSGGLIALELQLRAGILKSTVTMLEQKRESFLHGLTIVYRDPVPRVSIPGAQADAALKKATADVQEANQEAQQYSGGLAQTMALVREATAKLTEATVEQRIELARSGIPLPMADAIASPKTDPSPGKSSVDKDAL